MPAAPWPLDAPGDVDLGGTAPAAPDPDGPGHSFLHEAFFYENDDAFVAGTVSFLAPALERRDPVLAMTAPAKLGLLRAEIGGRPEVQLADMTEVGRNPGRIISAWHDFVRQHPDRRVWGIGEPVWPGRTDAEIAECHRHEALLNLVFADAGPVRLLCPYDAGALAPAVLEVARTTHPHVLDATGSVAQPTYAQPTADAVLSPPSPLPDPPPHAAVFPFDAATVADLRRFLLDEALCGGVRPGAIDAAVLVGSELAGNSVRHGGGTGTARIWRDGRSLVVEISDEGRIVDPLAGRLRPPLDGQSGRGLWLANQLADLVQLRSSAHGTVVRAHFATP